MTREELWLAAIAGVAGAVPPDYPVWHYEQMLAAIYDAVTGAASPREFPARSWHLDEVLYAVYCAVAGVTPAPTCPEPTCRLEQFWVGILGQVNGDATVTVPEPVWRIEEFLKGVFDAASDWGATLLTETGNAPITLTNAVARAIHSLTQTGLCTQASTPTPSSPVDIKCNNGALKMVDDELPDGYKRVLGFQCNNNAMWKIEGLKLRGSDTVSIGFSATAACNVFGCYQGADANDNYDLYVSTTNGSKYLRYGNGTYLSYWSADNLGQRFDVVFTPAGTSGMPQDSTWTEKTFEAENDMLIGATTLTGTSSKLKGNLYENIIVAGRAKLIPCERVSDGVLGYYNTYTDVFTEPYTGFDGAVSLGYDGSHYVLQTVGTPEVLTVSASGQADQTASVSDLLALDIYKDTQEIISGAVTRKVGVKVLDGTESFTTVSGGYYLNSLVLNTPYLKCTHFGSIGTPRIGTQAKAGGGYFVKFIVDTEEYPTPSSFKAWLAAQYAAGTPVIFLYVLPEATTESVAGQSLSTAAGTNTVSVTAEVSPVALTCEYYGSGS